MTENSNGAPAWAVALDEKLSRVESKLDEVMEVHEKILVVVNDLKPEVLSVIESLRKNPMFKMFLGGK